MRKFLCDYDSVWTEEQLRDFFANESDDREYMTFEQWLAECMGKNGALVEILTDDTPKWERERAVSLCRVHYSDDRDDYCDEWLNGAEQDFKKFCGYHVEC